MTDLELLHLINHTTALFRRKREESAENSPAGESGTPFRGPHGSGRILHALVMEDGVTQAELADKLHIRPQSLTEALCRLEKDGYVIRTRSSADRRILIVNITDSGRAHSREIEQLRGAAAADLFSCLTEEEKETTGRILQKVLDHAEE